MSKKKLNTEGILNELEGASLFFTPSASIPDQIIKKEQPKADSTPPSIIPTPEAKKIKSQKNGKNKSMNESMHARPHDSTHERMHSRSHGNIDIGGQLEGAYDLVETIRKTVKRVGKEEFYLRLTPDEKDEVTKIVFSFNEMYSGESRKISANDIGRIAIHFLLEDYQANGQQSILFKVLAALNA